MKKTELKKLIKESVKEILSEGEFKQPIASKLNVYAEISDDSFYIVAGGKKQQLRDKEVKQLIQELQKMYDSLDRKYSAW